MAHQSFDQSEFISVRYYMGTHGCPASTKRYNYYGMAGVPNLMFNGTHFILGAGTAAATGEQYMDIVCGRTRNRGSKLLSKDALRFLPYWGPSGASDPILGPE